MDDADRYNALAVAVPLEHQQELLRRIARLRSLGWRYVGLWPAYNEPAEVGDLGGVPPGQREFQFYDHEFAEEP